MTTVAVTGRVVAVRIRARSAAALMAVTLVGAAAFGWPFLSRAGADEAVAHGTDAVWVFVALVPLLLAVVLAEMADGAFDAKAIALLGVLAACGAGLRAVDAGGVTGASAVFFLLLPAGRVLGRGFGFVLGTLTLFASALLTGGVGPWLPFQMLAAGWVGFGAGCLPRLGARWSGGRRSGGRRSEVAVLAAYGFLAGLVYGAIMNLWFWPFLSDAGSTTVTFDPMAGPLANLMHYWHFYLVTSLGFDLPRALANAAFMLVAGAPILAALRRVARRAAFDAPVRFESGA